VRDTLSQRYAALVSPLEGGSELSTIRKDDDLNRYTCLTARNQNRTFLEQLMSDPTPHSEDVSSAFHELTSIASVLNKVSDALGKAVSDIDEGLKKLNLGISVWVRIHYDPAGPDDPSYYVEELGYAKIDGKWCTALRTITGSEITEEGDAISTYAFNEAPRALRLKAIDKLPALLKALTNESSRVTKELKGKLASAQAVAAVIKPNVPIAMKFLQDIQEANVSMTGLGMIIAESNPGVKK
jgi:hypothetical protein